MQFSRKLILTIFAGVVLFTAAQAQELNRVLTITTGGRIDVINRYGRVDAFTRDAEPGDSASSVAARKTSQLSITAASTSAIPSNDVKIVANGGDVRIEVEPADPKRRIDISISMPPGMKVKVETREGEVRITGDILSAEVVTDTGTIAADVPTIDLEYGLFWTASRPRFLADFDLAKIKEKAGGKFEIVGRVRDEEEKAVDSPAVSEDNPVSSAQGKVSAANGDDKSAAKKPRARKARPISLKFTTARGIILLNVPPNEVSSDLRERPLTVAAKAIIRSGDSLLMEAIRRAVPKYYGDYARTLPPAKVEPSFAERSLVEKGTFASVKSASVRVSDLNNRAIPGLKLSDFELTENSVRREIISLEPSTAPFNLVLLLDVSGSVDTYVNFIRKAARSFVETADSRDRISIVTFSEDVKVLSGFTADKRLLSESLDTFDAGGATAYYDSLAYTLAETLRPLKGERTAIVILTDGDDNRSFLPFDSMLSSIQESGALIYPLYVPSGLIAASESGGTGAAIDTLRTRYLQGELTSKAKNEGERLAKLSGGVYYPITRLSQIQTAYNDIVAQLRTAYTVTFRSDTIDSGTGASPRLKVKVNKPNAFATIGRITSQNGEQ
ncbi:MAG: VWA domain-containing protein [Pyrinomonadaceae bacterium]